MLDELRRFCDRHRLPSGDLIQMVEKGCRRIVGVKYLCHGAPPLGRALLEESDRIQVPIAEVSKFRLLERSRQSHGHRMVRQSLP